jgi:ABC-type amino acid transport substrate-binding protein
MAKRFFLHAVLCLLCVGGPGYNQEKLWGAPQLKISSWEKLEPKNKQLGLIALSEEFVRLTLEKMGYQADVQRFSNIRIYMMGQKPDFFGTFPWAKTPAREQDYYYSKRPLYGYGIVTLVHKDSQLRALDQSKIRGLTSCEGLTSRLLEAKVANIFRVSEHSQCIKMLERRRVDLIVYPEPMLNSLSSKLKAIPNDFINDVRVYFLVNKRYPEAKKLMEAFNAAFEILEKEDVFLQAAGKAGFSTRDYHEYVRQLQN